MPALVQNQNYLVVIRKGTSNPVEVQANAQAKLAIRVENRWVNIMEALGFSGDNSSVLGGIAANTVNTLQIFTGNNFLPNIATTHVWRGSNGIELQLELRFDAFDDPYKDVLQPVEKLIRMFMPTRGNASEGVTSVGGINIPGGQYFMHPPGPTPWEYINNNAADSLITVMLGKVLIIGNLIPLGIEWEFEQRYRNTGHPVAANVNVGFMNYTIPHADEVIAMFQLKS